MSEWRTIESAPKDGTEILAYSATGCTNVMLVRFIAMSDFLTETEIDQFIREGADEEMLDEPDWFFADFAHGDRITEDCYPTHWQPMPKLPPATDKEG